MRKAVIVGSLLGVLLAGVALGMYLSGPRSENLSISRAYAGGGIVKSPTGIAPDRYVYYPGTEELKPDEIRVVCCGSGMPAARHAQAAACWLIDRRALAASMSSAQAHPCGAAQ